MISAASYTPGVFLKTRSALLASFWFLVLVLLSGCDSEPEINVWKLSGDTMGTRYHLTVLIEPGILSQVELQTRVEQVLETINQQMSTYRVDSELSRLNRANVGQWIQVSPSLYQVLDLSTEISRLSQGAFDITVAPLVNLWGFGPNETSDKVPSVEEIESARASIGHDSVQFQMQPRAVRKQRPVYLDLSAIAKGYGVDQVAQLFDTMGISDYLIEIGGELRLNGHNSRGAKWRVGIETPALVQGGSQRAIHVGAAGVATSGDYRNYFEKDGKRYSHTIDPTTGYPITHELASVTVVADSAARADALATALNVMGPKRAASLAEAEGIAAFFIVRDKAGFRQSYSKAFAPYLHE